MTGRKNWWMFIGIIRTERSLLRFSGTDFPHFDGHTEIFKVGQLTLILDATEILFYGVVGQSGSSLHFSL
jgi:hypothetical protein